MKNTQPVILRFTEGPMKTRQFTLMPEQSYVIGSQSQADIRVDGDPSVSRRHASIMLAANGKLLITDLSSTNGTRLNGRNIRQEARIKSGDVIQLGLHTQCILHPWEALESSLPPSMTSGFELISKPETPLQNKIKMTVPLWFTVGGFCVGGLAFSAWQASEIPNNVFARTIPPGPVMQKNSPFVDRRITVENAVAQPDKPVLKSANDVDVPLVARDFIWDEIVNISQRFGEIPPSAMDPQFLKQVEHWINFYTKNSRHQELLRRRDSVWQKIEKILQVHGLPPELGYIVWVESAFNPDAVSHAGAVGLWQFIDSTGQEYGLIERGRSSLDKRRQIEASTHAAARYLNSLLEMFGNRRYLLALAAYNAGQNRIKRQEISATVKTSKQVDFWHLKETLPKETLDYVPKVLAAIIIGRNPENW